MESLVKRVLDHPVTPIVLGVAVALEGPRDISIRSAALLLCGGWLCNDLRRAIWEKRWFPAWKSICFSLVCTIIFVAVMSAMRWFLETKLEEEQTEAFNKLTVRPVMPPGGDDPLGTMFTATFGGSTAVVWHEILCSVNHLRSDHIVVKFDPLTPQLTAKVIQSSDATLEPGNSADSSACLSLFVPIPQSDFICADTTVIVRYALESDPENAQSRMFRFVTGKKGRLFEWYEKNPRDPQTYCYQ